MPFTSPVSADFGRTDPFGLARISQNALQTVLREQDTRDAIRARARQETRAGFKMAQDLSMDIARQGAVYREGLRRDNQSTIDMLLRDRQLDISEARTHADLINSDLQNRRANISLGFRGRELDRLDKSAALREREFDFSKSEALRKDRRQQEFEEAFLSTAGSAIDAGSLSGSLQQKISGSRLNGFVPKDGDKFGITTGSPEEWAKFMTGLAHMESSFDPKTVGDRGKFTGDSNGLFQLSPNDAVNWRLRDTPFTKDELFDPEFNQNTAVKLMELLVTTDGAIAENGVGASRYWGPLRRGQNPTERFHEINGPSDSLFPQSTEAQVAIATSRVRAAQSDFDDARQLGNPAVLRETRSRLDEERLGLEAAIKRAGRSGSTTEDAVERDKRLNDKLDQLLRRRTRLRDEDGEPDDSPLMLQVDSEIKAVSDQIRGVAPDVPGSPTTFDPRLESVVDAEALRQSGSVLK